MDDTSWMDPPKVPETRPCPRCDGHGKISDSLGPYHVRRCTFCDGTGKIPMELPK